MSKALGQIVLAALLLFYVGTSIHAGVTRSAPPLATVTPVDGPLLGIDWENLSSRTALIAVLGYIVVRILPAHSKEMAECSQRQAETFTGAMKDMHQAHIVSLDKAFERLAAQDEVLRQMTQFCATRQLPASRGA